MSLFELIMILCFGLSWPFSIWKSWRNASTRGKSLSFLTAIWIGYVAGILHKLIFSFDLIIIAYLLNLVMVSLDIALFCRNRRLEQQDDRD